MMETETKNMPKENKIKPVSKKLLVHEPHYAVILKSNEDEVLVNLGDMPKFIHRTTFLTKPEV